MFMVMCVIDDQSQINQVLAAWRQAGVNGATILESSGMQTGLSSQMLVLQRFSFEGMIDLCSEGHYTLLSIVPDEATVQASLVAAEKVVGDFSLSHTGIFASWPLTFVKGRFQTNIQAEDSP